MTGPEMADAPRVADGIHWVLVEDEAVVVDSHGGVHLLPGLAAAVWQCFDGHSTLSEIASDAEAVYGTSDVDIAEDIRRFVESLYALGLVASSRES